MNRIYQGRVNGVEIPQLQPPVESAPTKKRGKQPIEWQKLPAGEELLWQHHQLFQDAVNYYIMALSSLGEKAESPLTQLRERLKEVWTSADKKGQKREGLGDSMRRTLSLDQAPSFDEAIANFHRSFKDNNVTLSTTEKAGEFLLSKMGGAAAIQQAAPGFFPKFCWQNFSGNYDLTSTQLVCKTAFDKLLSRFNAGPVNDDAIVKAAHEASPDPLLLNLGIIAKLQHGKPYQGEEAKARIRTARQEFKDEISEETLEKWLEKLPEGFAIPRNNKCTRKYSAAVILFLSFPNQTTAGIFKSVFANFSKPKKETKKAKKKNAEPKEEVDYRVNGDDPIKVARGERGFVFQAFTNLPIWEVADTDLAWKEFDIAAFGEALKTLNQYNQNIANREEKLDGLAMRLLAMDGETSWAAYPDDHTVAIRLKNVWKKCEHKPKIKSDDDDSEVSLVSFKGDDRIDRLRIIVNSELAEEYGLTDGVRTPYGLRGRTIKGWSDVRDTWQKVVASKPFSEDLKQKLKAKLNELRSSDKKEKIGSHLFFESLLADEAAWNIWRKPTDEMETQIRDKNGSKNPVEDFRNYCEIRETIEGISSRPLNFTPADARYSRRLVFLDTCCSFGNAKGEFKHDAKNLLVTVPIVIQNESGKFAQQKIRISYSAPRLLRDGIRSADGSYEQNWIQPMVKAILGETKVEKQDLEKAAVQLMPDFKRDGTKRILLNFPLTMKEAPIHSKVGKVDLWDKQFSFWKDALHFLRWSGDFKKDDDKTRKRWWKDIETFRVLAADLGTRHAACVATIECSKTKNGTSRFIGNVENTEWHARFTSGKVLRLPGENVEVLRPLALHEKDDKAPIAFREELFGSRGRSATLDECRAAKAMLAQIAQEYMVEESAEELVEQYSFPELNDKLLVAFRRAQNTLATYFRWHWKLTNPEQKASAGIGNSQTLFPDAEKQRASALKDITEQDKNEEWKLLAKTGNVQHLGDSLHTAIKSLRGKIQAELLTLTSCILPLRGRSWEWVQNPNKEDCHLLRETELGSASEEVKIRGQRGLSMARIEQLSELRRRWQSLNQSLRKEIGSRPLTASEMRDDSIPDPCPDILLKLENCREQRVNQTAHLIIARALGLRLKSDKTSREERRQTDLHGEYEVVALPVDFIVLEDLNRYLTDQGRAHSENSRLMKWCHRAVLNKVKMLAEPFGISVLETQAAYSSRFCSLTGIAGFRAVEVSLADKSNYRWRNALKEATDKGDMASDDAKSAVNLFKALDHLPAKTTLLAPQPGGPIFVTAKEVRHPAPSEKRKSGNQTVLPMQADINAAINLALRAVASPDIADIHHRLRTEFIPDKKGSKTGKSVTCEKRRFPDPQKIEVPSGDSIPAERNFNLFYDVHGVADFGHARIAGEEKYDYASGPGIWKVANDRAKQWARCEQINRARCVPAQEIDPNDDLPM